MSVPKNQSKFATGKVLDSKKDLFCLLTNQKITFTIQSLLKAKCLLNTR